MYMYSVIASNTTTEVSSSNSNNNNTNLTQTNRTANNPNMPRNRSLSAASSPPPALLTRGFASLRRAHRRLSNSSPSSPITAPSGENTNITGNNSIPTSASAAATPGLGAITDEESSNRSLDNNNNTTTISSDSFESSNTTVRPRIRLVPNVGLLSRSFVFDIIDRELEPGVMYRIGRFSDRNALAERISFKSKVTSRNHAELWTENGKVYIHDIGSSSGTFLNRIRLSPPSHVSTPHEIKDGDTIQLGVDYQGGLEPIYRAVRIRVEINRQYQNVNNPYARTAFQQLRSQFMGSSATAATVGSPSATETPIQDLGLQRETTRVSEQASDIAAPPVDLTAAQLSLSDMMSRHNISDMTRADIQECCICLYAIAPFQCLFLSPCSHMFHFKCVRPIVYQNYPGFACPLCRSYFDLEDSMAVEVDEVLEAINAAKEQQNQQQQQQQQQEQQELQQQQITPVPEVNEEEEEDEEEQAGEIRIDQLDVTAESSIHPSTLSRSSSSNINEIEAEEAGPKIENGNERSASPTTFLKTSDAPYVSVPDDDDDNTAEGASRPVSSPARPIEMINNHTAQLQPRSNRNVDALLSATLVGSPVFEESVLPSTTLQNDGSSNIVS